MLKRYHQLLVTLIFIVDLGVTFSALAASFWIRFYSGLIPTTKGIPEVSQYLRAMPAVALIVLATYSWQRLYVARRVDHLGREAFVIAKATIFTALLLAAGTFFYRSFEFSRAVLIIFCFVNILMLSATRMTIRFFLRELRKKGWNQRHAVVVGCGKLGQSTAEKLLNNPWTGIRIVGFFDDRASRIGKQILGIPVLGRLDEVDAFIRDGSIDQLYIALPIQDYPKIDPVLDSLARETVDIRFVPDFPRLVSLKPHLTDFDGLPIMSIRESPIFGWNQLLKRTVDILLSLIVIFVLSPLFLALALLVKLTSKGPVFYIQERMGYDGKIFKIYKFRTMTTDAEDKSGAQWATANDPRRTSIGGFLRRLSLDELPQFVNVLKGDMSIVGPRPERPVFINTFRETIPRYMMRHKMKAGITGWAQVNGWRGNTSLKKRLQYDLYYVEHWSLWFDFRIMLETLRVFIRQKNAY
ncbi:MAG: undecaprenyl-phosphate glucose phosphotransferase [Gemmatimonadota bacterium]|nr:MAG: undecaprenyl-phosphate glucose phosphotransferase [Gemmatimonadota bacterium]